jgi:helix-turn-helix protein
MMGYFGSRSAPMGAVPADVVISTFFNFHPSLVRQNVPAVWAIAEPYRLLTERLNAADAMLRRILGDAIGSPETEEAAALARKAAEACRPEGRPLYAGHASLDWPSEPHLVLWHAISLLREYRGDGHIAAMVVEDIGGSEALVTHAAAGDISADVLRTSRQWPQNEWDAAVDGLRSRGLLDIAGEFTDAGRALRDRIEQRTDELALRPWEALGEDDCAQLRSLVRPYSKTIVDSGELTFAQR